MCVVCYLVVAPGDGEDVSSDGPADVPDDVNKLVEQLGRPGVPCRVLTRPDEHPPILPEIRPTLVNPSKYQPTHIKPAFNRYLTMQIPHSISEKVQLVKTYSMLKIRFKKQYYNIPCKSQVKRLTPHLWAAGDGAGGQTNRRSPANVSHPIAGGPKLLVLLPLAIFPPGGGVLIKDGCNGSD